MKDLLQHHIKVFDIKEHDDFKDEVIWLIREGETQRKGFFSGSDRSKGEDDFNKHNQKPYQKRLNEFLSPYFDKYCELIHQKKYHITKQWYVDYQAEDIDKVWKYRWHSHVCPFSSVYYLHMDDVNDRTQFRDMDFPFVEEGNLIIFPSFLVHRSIPTKGHKIIVSTNFRVDRALPRRLN